MTDEIYRVPVLLVMATTNRAYIFDLAPGQSMVEYLLKAGYDVYVMDWNPPRPDRERPRAGRLRRGASSPIACAACRKTRIDDANMIGYCMGGVLSTIYCATHTDGPVKNLVCFTTPVDQQDGDVPGLGRQAPLQGRPDGGCDGHRARAW